MKLLWKRVCLLLMIVVSAVTGVWAYFAPRAWYDNFPGLGLKWLPQLGPFNEHLASDAGAMFIAFCVLSVIALWRVREDLLVCVVGAGWLTFNLLHFIYHMTMLHMYNALDQTLNVITLALLVIASVVLVIPVKHRHTPAR
jgi:hypothetical protein